MTGGMVSAAVAVTASPALQASGLPEWRSWLGGVLVFLVVAATVEGLVRHLLLHRAYDWRAYAASLADALVRRLVDLLGVSIAAPVLWWVHAHRVDTLALDAFWQWPVLFLLHELAYYLYHRAAHRVRWFWASHAVHHSPNELTLATALRLGWTGKLTGNALFFAPLLWLGFSPLAVFGTLAANLLYQFWLHAAWIPRLGPLEWVLNTPSHHRVHHGCNPEYLDCNYGGVLIVYDRLFGTFVAERDDVPPRYGLTQPLLTYNPVRIALHEWVRLARDLRHAGNLRQVARALFAPPAEASPAVREPSQPTAPTLAR